MTWKYERIYERTLHASSLNIKPILMILSTGVYTKNFRFQISVPGPATVTRRFVIFLRHSKNNMGILPQIMTHGSLPYQFHFHAQWHVPNIRPWHHTVRLADSVKNYINATSPDWTSGVRFPVGGRNFSSPPRPDQFRAHPTSYAMDTRSSFHRVKETESEAYH
jgi:hypothetical protein